MQKGFELVNLHGTASGVIAVPVIGENGNWWIGNEDTGVSAQGPKGEPGSAGSGGGGVPIGTIIAYMGTKAPEHYLECDGSVFNIADYMALSSQIGEEFGQVDRFGGDGVSTFAVPDLRNEFLRGYHGTSEEQFSGDVGTHQEGTYIKNISSACDGSARKNLTITTRHVYTYEPSFMNADRYRTVLNSADDDIINPTYMQTQVASSSANITATGNLNPIDFLARPTNVAVLYCIKYE